MMKLLNTAWLDLKEKVLFSFEILQLYRIEVNASILEVSMFRFMSKFVNVLIMYLPIKVLLAISDTSSIKVFFSYELDVKTYSAILFAVTIGLYLFHTIVQIYIAKKFAIQKNNNIINGDVYESKGKKYTSRFLKASFDIYLNNVACYMNIVVMIILFYFLSLEFTLVFILSIFLFSCFTEIFIFNPEYSIIKNSAMSKKQALTILSSFFYLFIFFGLFFVYIKYEIPIHSAILILLFSRVSNSSVRELFVTLDQLNYNFKKYNNE